MTASSTDAARIQRRDTLIDAYFGQYGGQYVPEPLLPVLDELERAYVEAITDQVAQTTPLIEGEVNAIVEQALGGTIAQWPQVETKVVETATQLELAKYHYAVFETGAQITERTDALEEIIRHPQVGPHVSLARTFRPNEEGEDGRAGGLLCLRAPQAQHVEAIADVVFDALSAQERLRIHRMLGRQWAGFMESLGIGSYGWDHLTVAGV